MTDSPGEGGSAGERIAKVIARAGLCSRRDAERLIAAGRVEVDGKVLTSPAFNVPPQASVIVDGQPLPAALPMRLWRYHKPRGVVTTARDPQGRPTVFDKLPPDLPRLLSVGRLDMTSEGLLLLTTDGALKRRLELPSTGWTRRYRVRVHGKADPDRLSALAGGVSVDGLDYGPIQATLERQTGANAWLTVALKEGKNREIRRVMEHLGLTVNRLIRVAYGPFQLGNLSPGAIEEVPAKVLAEQLGDGAAPRPSVGRAKTRAKPRPHKARARGGQATGKGKRGAHRRRPA